MQEMAARDSVGKWCRENRGVRLENKMAKQDGKQEGEQEVGMRQKVETGMRGGSTGQKLETAWGFGRGDGNVGRGGARDVV